ncbi:MAG: hypothetical protein ACPF8V_10910 [Luteibaculum sp.]
MKSYDVFLELLPQRELAMVNEIFGYLTALPGVRCEMKYGLPFFLKNSWVCYINPLKEGGLELAFPRAYQLSNEEGIIDFKGRKQVGGIYIGGISDLSNPKIYRVIQEAILLDQQLETSL